MAYGTKFYSNIYDLTGGTWTVNLKKINYSGSTTNITSYSTSPLSIKYYGDRDDNSIVNGSECSFSFYYKTGSTTSELLTTEYHDYQVEIKKGSNVYWLGWMKPDNINARFVGNYYINLTATDGLSDLKHIEYPSFDTGNSRTNAISIIKTCLNEIGFTSLDIVSQCSTYDKDLMASGSSTMGVILSQLRFINSKDGRIVNLKCYEVLEYVLKTFSCKIFQSNGAWQIVNQNEINSKKHTYTWSSLALSTSNFNRLINIDDSKLLNNTDALSKIPPLKRYEVTFRNKRVEENLLNNGDFNDGTLNYWHNGTGGTNAFNSIYNGGGNMYLGDDALLPWTNYNLVHYVYCDPFYVNKVGATTLKISWDYFANTYYSGATTPLLWRADLVRIGGLTYTGLHQAVVDGVLTNYSATFTIPASGNYYFKLSLRPNVMSEVSYCFVYVDNVQAIPQYPSSATTSTFDRYINGTIASNVRDDEATIYFADSNGLSTFSEVGNIKVGTQLTTTWRNYGGLENLSLQRLMIYNRLKQYKSYKNYLRLSVRNINILFNNILGLDSKQYSIVGYTHDVLNNRYELELVEYLTVNPTVTYTETTLSTVDGN